MFCDGSKDPLPCPVCSRKYAHETGCKIAQMHEDLEELIVSALAKGYKANALMVEVTDRFAQ